MSRSQDNSELSALPIADHTTNSQEMSTFRLFALVFLPFVTGYFLSYYFRTVNAVLSQRLVTDLGLDAAQLGLMTSAYFLMAAAAQLPIGVALDRYGPRVVQIVLLLVAAVGALLFAVADNFIALFVARSLVGIGVASSLMSGLKAIALAAPLSKVGFYNGLFIATGAMGVWAATVPTELALGSIHWRVLFQILSAVVLGAAILIAMLVPRRLGTQSQHGARGTSSGLLDIYTDPFFWRLAPLSALCIGGAWALQGLWSAPWLKDVALVGQSDIAGHLLVMGMALSAGAVGFGMLLFQLTKRGIAPAGAMAGAALLFILAEVGLALDWPVPPLVLWCAIAVFGAGTVLSYTMTAQHFPKASNGRANCAINVLHFGAAFAVQSLVGQIVAMWPTDELGHYPPEAYKSAFLALAVVQLLAVLWFLRPMAQVVPGVVDPQVSRSPRQAWRTGGSLLTASLLALVFYEGAGKVFAPAFAGLAQIGHKTEEDASNAVAVQQLLERLNARLDESHSQLDAVHRLAQSQASRLEALEVRLAALSELPALSPARHAAATEPKSLEQETTVAPERANRRADPAGSQHSREPCAFEGPSGSTTAILHFERNQRALDDRQIAALTALAKTARSCAHARVVIRGHTDRFGPEKRNLMLSAERAELAAHYLALQGVASHRLDFAGVGSKHPIASNDTEAGRRANRRVELAIQVQ